MKRPTRDESPCRCPVGYTLVAAVALAVVWPTGTVTAQCVDHSDDPAGCQPSTFGHTHW